MASKFEQKFGKYAIKNLTIFLIGGYVLGYLIYYINPNMYAMLTFDPYYIMHGQVWRIITWVISMPESLGIFTIIMLFLYYSLGRTLEKTWGTYRYNVYLFSGFFFTIVGAFILYFILVYSGIPVVGSSGVALTGDARTMMMGKAIGAYTTTYYINTSIFLAFAATYPDQELLLYFIIPVKIKWLGLVYIVFMGIDVVRTFSTEGIVSGILVTSMIVFSLMNFLIYFFFTRKKLGVAATFKQKRRKVQYKQKVRQAQAHNTYENGARHKCAICGRTDLDNPNLSFRFCSKCSGNKEYCEDHLFTHEHN